jgi:Domain of unknown function (DUF4376)
MMRFNPSAWYWNVGGSTTKVFSSASGSYVALADATYEAWLAAGNLPTIIDTEANLVAVLAQQAPLVVVQTPAGLLAYAAKKQGTISAGGVSVNIGGSITVECSTDPASLVLLQGAASIAASTPSQTFAWVPESGSPITLTAAQITTMFGAVSSFIQATFTTLAAVISAINAGTVTTKAQVDAFASPVWPVNS